VGKFIKGEIVTIDFPFSDLTGTKRRPALILSESMGEDIILCQITATRSDNFSVELKSNDFKNGSLNRDSYIRPNKIFTAVEDKILNIKGELKHTKYEQVVEKIVDIIS
jgi:mRNA interferase MazF